MLIGIASADYMRGDISHDGQEHWGGSGFARLGQYVPHLRAAGHDVVTGVLWQQEGECLSVQTADQEHHYPDVILSQRLMHDGLANAYKIGRQAGQIVVNDVDDWYWGLSPDNEAFLHSHPKHNLSENTTFYKHSLGASSHITVSTPFLRDRVAEWFKGSITLIPNYVDTHRFTPVTITDTDVPEVGWVGSTSHRSGDIETLSGILAPMARADKIKLVHAGDYTPHSPSFASKLGCEEELISRKIPRVGPEDYPSLLDFEVGVVAMRDTPFNHAKSYIKGLEYAASGIPFIAPRFGEYDHLHNLWKGGGCGFYTAKKPADWIRMLNHLRDPGARELAQWALLENVKRHDIAIGAAAFVSYIEGLQVR